MGGWECPYHAKAVFKVSAKTGRPYVGCSDCHSFSRDRGPMTMQAQDEEPDASDSITRLVDALYAPARTPDDWDPLPF